LLDTRGVVECKSVRRVICSGEALPVELANRFFTTLRAELHNLYGPTEAAVDVSYWACQPDEARHSVPLGRPVANTRLYVLEQHLQPAPIGIPGELHIAGIQVGRGYLNRAELTAEKFIEDPFHGGRMYKTGDLCRVMPDGNIEFLGRIDFQVKIRGFRIELGEIESVLANHPYVRQVVVTARKETNGQQRLVAYFTSTDGTGVHQEEMIASLRMFLKQELPDYMIPAVFVFLETMPLSPNGKIDRKARPEPSFSVSTAEFLPPQTEVERMLAEIWCELLGLPQVGRDANFFELGGDSILSIQFISRAQTKGLYLTPRNVFESQTIELLARLAEQSRPIQAEQGMVSGDVLLTPIQHWFFEKHRDHPHHFNQSVLLELDQAVDVQTLSRALGVLARHHDALRLRFEETSNGWRQWIADSESIEDSVRYVDLSILPLEEQETRLQVVNKELQTSLNIHMGPLFHVALFDYGEFQPQKLLLVCHHLAVDFVSWQLLIHDLWLAYGQLTAGDEARLPDKTSSFKTWSEWISEYANNDKTTGELDYWLKIKEQTILPLPMDRPENRKQNRASDAEKVTVALSAAETKTLLRDVRHAYHTQASEILLTALIETLSRWTGNSTFLIDLEGHGRESETLDISRTVGWFTTLFPVCLQLNGQDHGTRIKSTKEQMRRLPQKGMGYGLLRYLNPQTTPLFSNFPKAEVIFNYGGQLKTVQIKALDDEQAEEGSLGYLLNIGGSVINDQLSFSWTFSRAIYNRATVEHLAQLFMQSLRNLIAHCLSTQAGGYVPEDFPLAALSQPELDRIIGRSADIADIYPLSPMQATILRQSLAAPNSGVYFTQFGFELDQQLDVPRFKQAWRQVVERHEILRTRFSWRGLSQPLQIVHNQAALLWDEQDWRGIPPDEQVVRLNELLQFERRAGFDLSNAAPMRFTLVRLDESLYKFFWHCHHLLLDGWTYPILFREVLELYIDPSAYLPAAHPYREYIAWQLQQDMKPAESFWRETLAGFSSPTPLPGQRRRAKVLQGYQEETLLLEPSLSADLDAFAHRHRLTPSVLFQAGWALALHQFSREHDVVFGVTVSGRSAPLAGIESRVGLYINTLPLRVRVRPEQPLLAWLRAIMQDQVQLEQYAYTPTHLLTVNSDQALFNSAIRFQNYPLKDIETSLNSGLSIRNTNGVDWWHYPLNLVIVPDSRVKLSINYDARLFDTSTIRHSLQTMELLVSRLAGIPPEVELKKILSV
jgi:non-ribosomal peptide synthase protein (TIGR01720 family)